MANNPARFILGDDMIKTIIYMIVLILYIFGSIYLIKTRKDKLIIPFIVSCLILMGCLYL